MVEIWSKVIAMNKPTYIFGDINIGRMEENDPERRQELKNLIPILDDIQKSKNVVLINRKPTRHTHHQTSTLLDLVLSNAETTNANNFCSEQDSIVSVIKLTPVTVNNQFISTRDTRNLTPDNLNNMIENKAKFNEIFSVKDPNVITSTFITDMNNIINTLDPTRRVQINKFNKNNISDEIKEAITKTDNQCTKAINSEKREEFRKAKNLQHKLNKMIEKKHTENIKRNMKSNKR